MRKSGVGTATATTTVAKTNTKLAYDSTKARFFYQGMFALKRLQLSGGSKSKTPVKSATDLRKR